MVTDKSLDLRQPCGLVCRSALVPRGAKPIGEGGAGCEAAFHAYGIADDALALVARVSDEARLVDTIGEHHSHVNLEVVAGGVVRGVSVGDEIVGEREVGSALGVYHQSAANVYLAFLLHAFIPNGHAVEIIALAEADEAVFA